MKIGKLSLSLIALSLPTLASAQLTVRSAGAADAATLLPTVAQFRTEIGGANNGVGAFAGSGGRREINWDAVPNGFSAPNNLPGGFFNQNSQRGLQMTGVGTTTGFMVSDSATGNGVGVRFDNLNLAYSSIFQTFSPQKLFVPLGGNQYDIRFFVPLTGPAVAGNVPATVSSFGAIFADVDLANGASLSFFDLSDALIGTVSGAAGAPDGGLTFLGAHSSVGIARIRVTQGVGAILQDDVPGAGQDMVAADDFIYSEPVAAASSSAPEPGTLAFVALGSTLICLRRCRETR